MIIETKKIAELKPAPYNPRKSNERQEANLKASLEKFGVVEPIIFNKQTGYIVGGHFRVRELKKLGYKEVECVIVDLDEEAEKELNIRLNANTGDWDFDLLSDWDKDELSDWGLDVPVFETDEVLEATEDDFDVTPPETPITVLGDLYEIGEHRLLCGDSTKDDDCKTLMGGGIANMIFTDPPYNVKINSIVNSGEIQHDEFKMASGEMSESEFISFLSEVFMNLIKYSKDGSIHYICMDWKHIFELTTAGKLYTELKNLCVWNKDNGGMGTFYRSKHELIFVYKNGKEKHINNFELGQHGRYRTNVWDYAGQNSFSKRGRIGNKSIGDSELSMHPTVKPVELVADAILDCSLDKDVILDLFLGSGTTMVASHQMKRKCYGMELDPKYCDVIVKRMIKLDPTLTIKRNGVVTKDFQ